MQDICKKGFFIRAFLLTLFLAIALPLQGEAQQNHLPEGPGLTRVDAASVDNAPSAMRSEESASSKKMRENDPDGYAMSIMSMTVVFGGLLVLFLAFKGLSNAVIAIEKSHKKRKEAPQRHPVLGSGKQHIDNEVAVAIAMALEEELFAGDPLEPGQLTFGSIERKYTPWNSKALSLRSIPQRNH